MRRKDELRRVLERFLATAPGPERDKVRDEALSKYDYLVPSTIARVTNIPYGQDSGDLEQAGRSALWNALEHYDPNNERGADFVTFAIVCIRKAISRAITRLSWSKAAAENERKLNRARATLEQKLGRPATLTEIAEALEVSESKVADMVESCNRNRPLYLNQACDENEETSMHLEDIVASDEVDHFTRLLHKEQARILVSIADSFRDNMRETAILLLQCYTVKEIAEILGVSDSRAGMIVAAVRETMYNEVIRQDHGELFSEWLENIQPGVRPGRIRVRKRKPKMALMIA